MKPDTVTQDRDIWIGGSDVSIIMGLSTFATREQLLHEKAKIVEREFAGNKYTNYGNELEPLIRLYINTKMDRNFKEACFQFEQDGMRCNVDGIDETTVLEIKTTSKIKQNADEYTAYLVQLLTYMHYTGKKKGILAVYERPADMDKEFDKNRLYIHEINYDDYLEMVQDILNKIDKFKKDLQIVKQAWEFGIIKTELDLIESTELITKQAQQLLALEQRVLEYKPILDQIELEKAKLLAYMLKEDIKTFVMPNGTKITATAPTQDKTAFEIDTKLMIAENQVLAKKYEKEVIKKGRAGSLRITPVKE